MWSTLGARALRRSLQSATRVAARALPAAPSRCAPARRRLTGKAPKPAEVAPEEDIFDWRTLWSLVKFGAFLHCLHERGPPRPVETVSRAARN